MDEPSVSGFLKHQDGVISRRQVVAARWTDDDIERKLRRNEWVRAHPGVFVNHTGQLSWDQRAWAAVLFYQPAALAGASALQAHGVRTGGATDGPIVVVVDRARRVKPIPGVRVRRLRGYATAVMENRSPPCLRLEHTLLDAAAEARDDESALAILADACQERRTSPQRLLDVLCGRSRLRRRRWISEVLSDVASGAYSVLEHRFLSRVERAHGLPTGERQRVVRSGREAAYRDVEYLGFGMVVELDGRLGHEQAEDRWADLDRDVETAVEGGLTVRLGWKQVLNPCRTAAALVLILRARGWTGEPLPCSPSCILQPLAA